jgi:hypothetical protein
MKSFDWKSMDPEDGFFARLEIAGTANATLAFGFQVEAADVNEIMVSETIEFPTTLDVGKLRRKLIIWEAMAEYLNAGGDISEVTGFLGLPFNGFQIPGWNYFDTAVSEDGNRIHEFVSDDGERYVRWVRNEYVDCDLTLEDILDDEHNVINFKRGTDTVQPRLGKACAETSQQDDAEAELPTEQETDG